MMDTVVVANANKRNSGVVALSPEEKVAQEEKAQKSRWQSSLRISQEQTRHRDGWVQVHQEEMIMRDKD